MSEYVDFHYMPLDGRITGKQVLQQTEDAINDLGNKVYNLDIDQSEIDEAIEKSNEAINTANSALAAVTTGRSVWFNNVAEMVATDIEAGVTAETKGYHVSNDGGNALYLIRQEKSGDVVDGGSLIALDNGNMAELVTDGTVNVKQFGAIGNGTDDDTTVFQNTSSYAQAKGFVPFVGVATYKITGSVTGTFNSFGEVTITGGGTVDIINLQEVVSDVSDIRDEVVDETASAKAYSESAATSATSATNTANALINFLETKETITAPAVDPTLTISGAAADAKVTGDELTAAETFNGSAINQAGFYDTTKIGYYRGTGERIENSDFSCSSIFNMNIVPTYYTTFHSVVTWKKGVCNGQTTYADIDNVPPFDKIAFNYSVYTQPIGATVRYGGKYADPDAIEQNAADIAEIDSMIDGLNDKIGIKENITYNQTNQLTWAQGLYTNTGEISTVLADFCHSGFVQVQPGDSIVYTNLRAYGTWCLIAAFDGAKQFLSAKTLFASDTGFKSGTWTVPSGVSFISLAAYNPINATVNKWEATIPQYVWVADLIQNVGSAWNGKSAVIIGDSITAGAYTPTGGGSPDAFANPTFWKTASDMQGLSTTGYGISGTSISRTTDTLPSYAMSIRYVDMANADLVIVAGGTNDYGTNVALGTIADQTDISFYGALNVLCDGLQTKYPGKRIVFITPIHRANEGANQAGATLEQYRKAIYDVARDVYGFVVIDGKTMGISCKNASFKNIYIYDGLHPTQEGHDLYGKCLGHALNSI